MVEFELGVFARQGLRDHLPPQPRAGQDIGLVNGMDGKRRVCGQCDLSCNARNPLHLADTVDHGVPGSIEVGFHVLFLPGAKIGSANQFAHDNHVHSARDFRTERGVGQQGFGGKVSRPNVGVQTEGFPEGQESLFRPHFRVDAPLGPSNRACAGFFRTGG